MKESRARGDLVPDRQSGRPSRFQSIHIGAHQLAVPLDLQRECCQHSVSAPARWVYLYRPCYGSVSSFAPRCLSLGGANDNRSWGLVHVLDGDHHGDHLAVLLRAATLGSPGYGSVALTMTPCVPSKLSASRSSIVRGPTVIWPVARSMTYKSCVCPTQRWYRSAMHATGVAGL